MIKKEDAEYWITHLKMIPHPEGGYFREEYRAGKSIPTAGKTSGRSAMTTIFYLLEKDDFSAFHRIQSPESWFFHRGTPLLIYSFEKGTLICRELSDQENGALQVTIEPGVWFAACLKEKSHFALVSCAVAPSFEYEEFELAARGSLLSEYPDYEQEIMKLTR